MSITYRERSAMQATLNATAHTSDSQLDEHYNKAVKVANGLQMMLIVLFVILGAVAAPLAFANTSELNIFWLLLILLGAHSVSLLLWLVGLMTRTPQVGGSLQWFGAAIERVGKMLRLPPAVLECFLQLRFRGPVGKWAIGRLVHACWTGYLLGGLCSALLYLMTHQVHFIWETTLLTQQDFFAFTQWLSVVPSWLGAPAPTLQDIQMSQIGVAEQDDATRKLWGVWILVCILIYGVLVRLAFTGISHLAYRRQRTRLWTALTPKSSSRQQTHILDADVDHTAPTQAPPQVTGMTPDIEQAPLDPSADYYLFEWSKAIPAYLASLPHLHQIKDATDQAHFLAQTTAQSVLVLDAQISPDRGSLRFISQASAQSTKVYLHGQSFVLAWSQQLQARGIAAHQIKQLEA